MKMSKRTQIEQFVKERNEALFSLDEKKIKAYLTKLGVPIPENEQVFWGGIYKSICNITNAPADVVEIARERLKEMGWSEGI